MKKAYGNLSFFFSAFWRRRHSSYLSGIRTPVSLMFTRLYLCVKLLLNYFNNYLSSFPPSFNSVVFPIGTSNQTEAVYINSLKSSYNYWVIMLIQLFFFIFPFSIDEITPVFPMISNIF